MNKFFKGCLLAAMAVVFVAAGYTAGAHHVSLQEAGKEAAKLFGPSEACAHTGGDCYLDDNNLQTVENKCYSKCQRSYTVALEMHACEVGCSTAISVATKKIP